MISPQVWHNYGHLKKREKSWHAWHTQSLVFNPKCHLDQMPFRPVIPALGKWRQDDRKFKVIVSLIARMRPAWATWDPSERRSQSGRKGDREEGSKSNTKVSQVIVPVTVPAAWPLCCHKGCQHWNKATISGSSNFLIGKRKERLYEQHCSDSICNDKDLTLTKTSRQRFGLISWQLILKTLGY